MLIVPEVDRPSRFIEPNHIPGVRFRRSERPPRRTAPYDQEPGYYALGRLWLYGNARLLSSPLAYIERACRQQILSATALAEIEAEAERFVLDGKVLVCGCHNEEHRRAAVVPLRWGAPRILVVSGGFKYHLGKNLKEEPFRTARLWRYQWDPLTDLAVSRRAPDKLPTYAHHNPTVDRLIELIATGRWPGLQPSGNALANILAQPG